MATAKKKLTGSKKKSAGSKKKKTAKKNRWSARVTKTSDALDLEQNIFRSKDPGKIARSLKRSAEKSKRRKGTAFQSAMSMLNFYINRAGKNLSKTEKRPLEKAKKELRQLFKKEPPTKDKRKQ